MPAAVSVLAGVLVTAAIPAVVAMTNSLIAQATALTAATGGLNLLFAAAAAVTVGGVAYVATMDSSTSSTDKNTESTIKNINAKKGLTEAEQSFVDQIKAIQNDLLSENEKAIKAEEDKLKKIQELRANYALTFRNSGQRLDELNELSRLEIEQTKKLNEVKDSISAEARAKQKQIDDDALQAAIAEDEAELQRKKDVVGAMLDMRIDHYNKMKAIKEQYMASDMAIEDRKVDMSDAINKEIEDMTVNSTKSVTDNLILEYNREVNAKKDALNQNMISQMEYDEWMKLRTQELAEAQIDIYKQNAQAVADIMANAFKDLFVFDNEAWEEKQEALKEQREQADINHEERIAQINKELSLEGKSSEEKRALLREKSKAEKDYAKEKQRIAKEEEAQDALKNDRFKEMTKNAVKASIDMLAAKGAAAAFAQVMMTVPFPGNLILAPIAYTAAYTGISAAKLLFKKGGYTGSGNPDDEAGIVHKEEFVQTAETVDRVGIPALEALQDGRATIVPISSIDKPDAFTGSVNVDYIANSVQALSTNLVSSDGGIGQRETFVINNSDFVKVTRKIEQTKSENKNIATNKTTRSYR